jgi:hypothetical protein
MSHKDFNCEPPSTARFGWLVLTNQYSLYRIKSRESSNSTRGGCLLGNGRWEADEKPKRRKDDNKTTKRTTPTRVGVDTKYRIVQKGSPYICVQQHNNRNIYIYIYIYIYGYGRTIGTNLSWHHHDDHPTPSTQSSSFSEPSSVLLISVNIIIIIIAISDDDITTTTTTTTTCIIVATPP